jgi:hypothetical protein
MGHLGLYRKENTGEFTAIAGPSYSFSNEDEIVFRRFGGGPGNFFVDIGASDGIMWSNSRMLAESGWRGVCVECDEVKMASLRALYPDGGTVKAIQQKVNRENVNKMLAECNVPKEIELLSLDIDGMDAWVLIEILKKRQPQMLVVEINQYVMPPFRFCVKYDPNWTWGVNQIFGASVQHYHDILSTRGYGLSHILPANAIFERGAQDRKSVAKMWEEEYVPAMIALNGEHAMPMTWKDTVGSLREFMEGDKYLLSDRKL